MAPIISHVVAAERQHRHRIAPHDTHGTGGCRGRFGWQCRPEKSAMLPIEGLIDERNHLLAARAEKYRTDGHALGLFPLRRIARALLYGHRKAGIRVGRRVAALRVPWLAAPIHSVAGDGIAMTFPPDGSVRSQRHVGENAVSRDRPHCVAVSVRTGARRDAETAGFRIDRPKPAVRTDAQPGNIIADGVDLPALHG